MQIHIELMKSPSKPCQHQQKVTLVRRKMAPSLIISIAMVVSYFPLLLHARYVVLGPNTTAVASISPSPSNTSAAYLVWNISSATMTSNRNPSMTVDLGWNISTAIMTSNQNRSMTVDLGWNTSNTSLSWSSYNAPPAYTPFAYYTGWDPRETWTVSFYRDSNCKDKVQVVTHARQENYCEDLSNHNLAYSMRIDHKTASETCRTQFFPANKTGLCQLGGIFGSDDLPELYDYPVGQCFSWPSEAVRSGRDYQPIRAIIARELQCD